MRNEILQIDVNMIVPNLYQPRKYFREEALKELSESIKHNGILQPLSVRVMGDRYELVAGERRWRAAKSIGLDYVPCTILDITDVEVFPSILSRFILISAFSFNVILIFSTGPE